MLTMTPYTQPYFSAPNCLTLEFCPWRADLNSILWPSLPLGLPPPLGQLYFQVRIFPGLLLKAHCREDSCHASGSIYLPWFCCLFCLPRTKPTLSKKQKRQMEDQRDYVMDVVLAKKVDVGNCWRIRNSDMGFKAQSLVLYLSQRFTGSKGLSADSGLVDNGLVTAKCYK